MAVPVTLLRTHRQGYAAGRGMGGKRRGGGGRRGGERAKQITYRRKIHHELLCYECSFLTGKVRIAKEKKKERKKERKKKKKDTKPRIHPVQRKIIKSTHPRTFLTSSVTVIKADSVDQTDLKQTLGKVGDLAHKFLET